MSNNTSCDVQTLQTFRYSSLRIIQSTGRFIKNQDFWLANQAWAIKMRCFWPPEKEPPPSINTVFIPIGN